MTTYAVIYERSERSWGAYVPDLPGCVRPAGRGLMSNGGSVPPSSSTWRACARTAWHRPSRPQHPVPSTSSNRRHPRMTDWVWMRVYRPCALSVAYQY